MALTILTVVGARPQFVKAGPVSRAIAEYDGMDEILLHTGQHFDQGMSDVFFEDLRLPEPKYNLGISSQTHGKMTAGMLEAIEQILFDEKPDALMVYGDTNSTLAGALAASKLAIPIIHVEAGLRSFNRRMPEEINRVVTDHLATLQFCPTQTAVDNLAHEGITRDVFLSGDVMHDATLYAIEARRGDTQLLDRLGLAEADYSVCTLHRAENTDDPENLAQVCQYLSGVARDTRLVLPLHPRTRNALAQHSLAIEGAEIIEPLGYFDFHTLLASCEAIYTDSGGLQKEAYFHRKPCVTLRDETEWVETISHGWNRLWQGPDYPAARTEISDYGDGHAAQRIIDQIAASLG